MNTRPLTTVIVFFGLASLAVAGMETNVFEVRKIQETKNTSQATLRVQTQARSENIIPAFITGKFAEHLHANVINGMDAQILRNPTFADFPFATREVMNPDGVAVFDIDETKIAAALRHSATNWGWPKAELDDLVMARTDGLATFWGRVGGRSAVQVSPDTGPYGGRAQRIQVREAGQGIAQWAYLPLHRIRKLDFEILARSPDVSSFTLALTAPDGTRPCAAVPIRGLSREWNKFAGSIEVPSTAPAEGAYKLELTADAPGQFVVKHVFLRPADHLNGADPEVIQFLKESHLPLLRWPGGNFSSGYHWEDGVGPVERRPTKPNYAWGEVEPNLFGTDEFVTFCRAVGCEPMICINGASGTPEEAARWIEYCNGPVTSPMGARRAANGHPESYHIKYWEVGNELWGKFQYFWTTPQGNVDRYREFSAAMLAADPAIKLYGCGATVMWGHDWDEVLVRNGGSNLTAITDHPLIGGDVSRDTSPLDVYRDFLAVPEVMERKWARLRDDMLRAGIKDPHVAVTELMLFAHLGKTNAHAPVLLTSSNLVSPDSLAEAISDVLYYHAAVRLTPFVEIITQSATLNHGGGLCKEHEHVYAQPTHYAQSAFAAFAGATPVQTEIECGVERAPRVLPQLREGAKEASFSLVDAVSAMTPEGDLLISIVQRSANHPIELTIELNDFKAGNSAEVRTLTGKVPWARNSLKNPDNVRSQDSTVAVTDGKIKMEVPPYTVMRVRVAHR